LRGRDSFALKFRLFGAAKIYAKGRLKHPMVPNPELSTSFQ